MKMKFHTVSVNANADQRWQAQYSQRKLKRAIERQFKQDYDRW